MKRKAAIEMNRIQMQHARVLYAAYCKMYFTVIREERRIDVRKFKRKRKENSAT